MLVLDANILIRAGLVSSPCCATTPGRLSSVRQVQLSKKLAQDSLEFSSGGKCWCLLRWQSWDQPAGLVQTIEAETYESFEHLARQPIAYRDEDDWPALAVALALECPIWAGDTDFFGCGVATWTTDRVELYLAKVAEREQRRILNTVTNGGRA